MRMILARAGLALLLIGVVRPSLASNFPPGHTAATTTTTIANGASLSGAVDLTNGRLTHIVIPATWTTANLTFQVSYDCSNYANLYDELGVEYQVTVTAVSTAIKIPYADFIGARCIKIRSGTSGAATNQGGSRTLNLLMLR